MIYIDLFLLTVAVAFIVDVSGFTQTWLGWISRFIGAKVTQLRPFSCSLCMTFWTCIVFTLCTGTFNTATLAVSCILAALAYPIGQAIIFLQESLLALTNKLLSKL